MVLRCLWFVIFICYEYSLTVFRISGRDQYIICNILPVPDLNIVWFSEFTGWSGIHLLRMVPGLAGVRNFAEFNSNLSVKLWIITGWVRRSINCFPSLFQVYNPYKNFIFLIISQSNLLIIFFFAWSISLFCSTNKQLSIQDTHNIIPRVIFL